MILPLVELNKLNKEGEEYVPKTRDMSFKYSTRLIVLALAENATLPSWHATLSSPVLPPPPQKTNIEQLTAQMPAQLQGRRSVLAALNLV